MPNLLSIFKQVGFFVRDNLFARLGVVSQRRRLQISSFQSLRPFSRCLLLVHIVLESTQGIGSKDIHEIHKLTLFVSSNDDKKNSKHSLPFELVRPFNRSQWKRYQAHQGADDVCFSIHIFMSCFGAGKGANSKGYKVETKPTLLPSVWRGWGRTMWREWGF